jgi:hypothetical protein
MEVRYYLSKERMDIKPRGYMLSISWVHYKIKLLEHKCIFYTNIKRRLFKNPSQNHNLEGMPRSQKRKSDKSPKTKKENQTVHGLPARDEWKGALLLSVQYHVIDPI